MGEHPTRDARPPDKRRPPLAPSCRPHSAQSQLARACGIRLVTGPNARTPRTHSLSVVGPWRHAPKGRVVGSGRAADPGRPTPRQQAPPPGARVPHPQRAKPARKSARGWVGEGPQARIPRTRSQWVVGPGRTPESKSGRGSESAEPRAPHTQAIGAPPGHCCAAPTARKASSQERALWSL